MASPTGHDAPRSAESLAEAIDVAGGPIATYDGPGGPCAMARVKGGGEGCALVCTLADASVAIGFLPVVPPERERQWRLAGVAQCTRDTLGANVWPASRKVRRAVAPLLRAAGPIATEDEGDDMARQTTRRQTDEAQSAEVPVDGGDEPYVSVLWAKDGDEVRIGKAYLDYEEARCVQDEVSRLTGQQFTLVRVPLKA